MRLLALGTFCPVALGSPSSSRKSLNAPLGARCFLALPPDWDERRAFVRGLNAPFGARCFLANLTFVGNGDLPDLKS